jgi:hypothetical protein
LCFVNNTQKSKMQDNQDKETRVYRLCCKNWVFSTIII